MRGCQSSHPQMNPQDEYDAYYATASRPSTGHASSTQSFPPSPAMTMRDEHLYHANFHHTQRNVSAPGYMAPQTTSFSSLAVGPAPSASTQAFPPQMNLHQPYSHTPSLASPSTSSTYSSGRYDASYNMSPQSPTGLYHYHTRHDVDSSLPPTVWPIPISGHLNSGQGVQTNASQDVSKNDPGALQSRHLLSSSHPASRSSSSNPPPRPPRGAVNPQYVVRNRSGDSSTPSPSASLGGSYAWIDHRPAGPSMPVQVAGTTAGGRSSFTHNADMYEDPSMQSIQRAPQQQIIESQSRQVQLAPLCGPEDMLEHFPLSTEIHQRFRVELLKVINAVWRRANQKEPDPSLLLQFTSKIEENGFEKYRCLFWSEGSECGKNIPRSDRMLEHLRRHVGVRPWLCDCNSDGCPGVFPSKSAMYQHQKNVEPVQCQRCGAQVLRQNLARHWRAQRCQRPEDGVTET